MADVLAKAQTAPKNFESLKTEIADRYGRLSGQLKRIAEFALDRPDDLALATVSSIAQSVGVQPSSVVRFAKAFGYDGFSDMQQLFRQRLIAEHRLIHRQLATGERAVGRHSLREDTAAVC